MVQEGQEIHTETDEARGGSTPHVVRWVLGISLVLAIVLLSAIWIIGAASQNEVEAEANVANRIDVTTGDASQDMDMVVSDDFDRLDEGAAAGPGREANRPLEREAATVGE